ncbi:MAG: type II toxin-antitoxin system YoeB family toxin [Lachnospiraceae bacterium]|nr:type II toxin-antitoxin system YoeB family toxin [Lachnospiraceae bacterium]
MNRIWSDIAWEDYVYWQTQDKKTLKKINELLREIESLKSIKRCPVMRKSDLEKIICHTILWITLYCQRIQMK